MPELTKQKSNGSKQSVEQRAASLLNWLIQFLPTALPPSAEEAILDTSGDIHALLWHRSELENLVEEFPSALDKDQKQQLAELDTQMRKDALYIVGAEKGHLHRYREGRYDRSHWWWYLDDMLREERMKPKNVNAIKGYSDIEGSEPLQKVADDRVAYERKPKRN